MMSDAHLPYDDEIDIFELIETLWDGKGVIACVASLFLVLASALIVFQEPDYESKMFYSTEILPPFYTKEKASADFQRMFFSKNVFVGWQRGNKSSQIEFSQFAPTQIIEGYQISTSEGDRLAVLASEKNQGNFILIRTGDLKSLNDFYNYARHINDLLKSNYVGRAREELNIIESHFQGYLKL